ncbi:MAG: HdeD family acid-resistance protein [Candidatus Nanopelagicales bacterium]
MTTIDPGTGMPMGPGGDMDAETRSFIKAVGESWWVLLFLGLITLALGVVVVAWPKQTILVVAVLFAIYLLVSGIFQLVRGFASGLPTSARVLLWIGGVLSLVLGIFAITSVGDAVWLLALFIGLSFIFRGMLYLVLGFQDKGADGRGWQIFTGIVMVIGGGVIVFWPGITLLTLAFVMGFWLIFTGLMEIIGAFVVRSRAKKALAA